MLPTRKLGELEVTAIGLGCMGMSISYGEMDDDQSRATLHHAIDRGLTFLDTADMYGAGHNERLIGEVLKSRRDEVVLATKFGNIRKPDGTPGVSGHPDYVVEACDKSLERLGIDRIDLFYAHRIDPEVPIEDTVGAMSRLVEAGKVGHIGLSEAAPATLRRAHATHPVAALQTEYSLWTRDVEAEILPTCRELGIGFVAYSPLGRGFLSGTVGSRDDLIEKDRRRDHPRFAQENIAQNLKLVEALKGVAGKVGGSPAQVALAWLLTRGEDIVPIPGTKKTRWVDENITALDLTLGEADLQVLESAFPPGVTAGLRYPESNMALLNG